MPVDHTNNLTLRILQAAHEGGYAINAQSCYDAQSVIALVRAAEEARSPALCQLFPVTMAQFGKPFVKFCLDTCHAASVPIAVHLDHAASDEDITRALDWAQQGVALDSIMIDCSHHDTDEDNIAMAKPYVQRANSLGMAVEVELGRLAGGEAGVRVIEEGMLTKPEKASRFLTELGAQMLAPSIGNIHGRYVNPPAFRLELLEALQSAVGPGTAANSYLVLHGTDDLPDELFRDCVRRGAYKINVNSWARDPQVEFWAKHLEKDPLPDVYEGGMQQFAKVCNRFFHLLGSAGKA
ncbi:fructose 1,6-bisphosphate aldolase [Moesziomyces antarcticus T-34]|uniref:Fructose-bisphosphate aldolase n=1 Tax=Pseudozyma antarctica (strain T-34) TaxID=1151754 RepID=M9MAX2_PSEA3|nr:fructose 1,6-bisphosphate aldolase [Moesziomyces antarcticus T-34]